MTNHLLTGIAAVIVAVIASLFLSHPQLTPQAQKQVGALAGPDIISPYIGFGNVHLYASEENLIQNASTTCALQSPPATSTLVDAGIRFDVASTGQAIFIEIGQAANPNSTTTLIGTKYNIAAGAQAFVQASTSPAAGAATVFAPNQYFNIKIATGTTGTVPTGDCHALWAAYDH